MAQWGRSVYDKQPLPPEIILPRTSLCRIFTGRTETADFWWKLFCYCQSRMPSLVAGEIFIVTATAYDTVDVYFLPLSTLPEPQI